MSFTFSDSSAANSYYTVKTKTISFTNEREFYFNLVSDLGLIVDYPVGWTNNPNWTPSQRATNTPMLKGVFALNITDPQSNYNFGNYFLNSAESEINLGRFILYSGSTSAPLVLESTRLKYLKSFPFGSTLKTFSFDEEFYNVKAFRVSLNAAASGGLTINYPIPL